MCVRSSYGAGGRLIFIVQVKKYQKQEQNQMRYEEKRRDMEMLNNYNPWGKPGQFCKLEIL